MIVVQYSLTPARATQLYIENGTRPQNVVGGVALFTVQIPDGKIEPGIRRKITKAKCDDSGQLVSSGGTKFAHTTAALFVNVQGTPISDDEIRKAYLALVAQAVNDSIAGHP